MSCVGAAPTLTSTPSLSSVSCSNTISGSVDAVCGSSGYDVRIYRDTSSGFGSESLINTISLPDGPLTGYGFSYDDTPPCFNGDYYYRVKITCAGAIQSTANTSPASATSGGSPSLSNDTISSANCENTLSITVNLLCGTCGGTAKLYRTQGSGPTFVPGEVIYTDTINAGPSTHTSNYTDTPPCVRGTYYYQWRIELTSGNTTGSLHTSNSGGPAEISVANATFNSDCLVSITAQVEKPCGECAGSIKCYRSGNGAAVTFAPGEVIFSDTVPAGPLIGLNFQTTDSPGDGTWTYAWRIFNDAVGADDTRSAGTVDLRCHLALYNPHTTPLPVGQMEKQIVLVNVTRGGARGYVYTDTRILNLQEQRMEWWIHKNGGCGAFRFLTHDKFPEIIDDESTADSWEIHVRIKLAGEKVYTTWYRGIIRSVKIEEQGAEQFSDIRGYGYVELLDNIQVQKQYPAGLTVKQIVDDIVDTYLKPNTRIRRPSDIDVTNGDSGVDASPYVSATPIHFECSALKALKFLAELQGNREFGIDADGYIYFRQSISTIIYNFFLSKDIVKKISGGKTFIQANEIKVAGKSFGARDFLQVRPDVTDISYNGVYETPMEVPWVTGDKDASTWADNIIARNKGQQKWSVFTWKGVTRRLDVDNPIGKITIYGDDISNNVDTYDIAKIQYVEGGWISKQELRDIGSPTIQPELDQQLLKATFYVGYYPRDLVEEIEVRLREQIEFLKGRHKQLRYPNDITNRGIEERGKIPGELKHYHKVPDITNIDITNNPADLSDITNPRGLVTVWIGGQWVKVAIRRTFHTLSGVRGLYIGEIAALITDPTNAAFGTVLMWDGQTWTTIAGGSSSGSSSVVEGARVINNTPQNANSSGVDVTYSTEQSNDNGVADLGSDDTILTAQSDGPFTINGRIRWSAGTNGTYHRLDLVNVDTSEILDRDIRNDFVSNGISRTSNVSETVFLLSGQRIKLVAYTDATDDGNIIEYASLGMYFSGSGGVLSTAVVGNPTGPASGSLRGIYPSPGIAAGAVTDVEVDSDNKDGLATVPSMRTIGGGALQAAPGTILTSLLTTKGDLITRSATVPVRLPVGDRERAIIADPDVTNGIRYSDKFWIYNKYRRESSLQGSQGSLSYIGWFNATALSASTYDPDADGGWQKYTTTTILNNTVGHPLTEANGILLRTILLPACWVKYKTGPLSTDIQNVRTWLAFIKDIGSIASTSNPISSMFAIRFDTSQGDTNWMIYTSNGSAATVTDSGVLVAANTAYRFGFVFTATSNLLVYINDVLVATITTNLPLSTDNITWNYYLTNLLGGTARSGKFEKLVCSQE